MKESESESSLHPAAHGISYLIPLVKPYTQLDGEVESAFFLSEPMKQQQGALLKKAFGLNILRASHTCPLIPDDMDAVPRRPLEMIFLRNGDRRRVYVTYGVTQGRDAPTAVVEGIRYMLESGIAVVLHVEAGRASLLVAFPNTCFNAQCLPMHYECSNVDLVFHCCGSGPNHYPLPHGLFSVTLGTQKCDREDVALQLQQLGVSRHIPSPLENQKFRQAFRACGDQYGSHDD